MKFLHAILIGMALASVTWAQTDREAENPALVNREPYVGGWFFRLKLARPDELEGLLSAGAYRVQIGQRDS